MKQGSVYILTSMSLCPSCKQGLIVFVKTQTRYLNFTTLIQINLTYTFFISPRKFVIKGTSRNKSERGVIMLCGDNIQSVMLVFNLTWSKTFAIICVLSRSLKIYKPQDQTSFQYSSSTLIQRFITWKQGCQKPGKVHSDDSARSEIRKCHFKLMPSTSTFIEVKCLSKDTMTPNVLLDTIL